ncbi:MAG: M16 family metallopeptidase [Planctomycetota bacterium]|jgi:predicted Zn-dependent peptidase
MKAPSLTASLQTALCGALLALLIAPAPALADGEPKTFEEAFVERVHEFELENGLRLLVLPRGDVPVYSAVTMVNVGSVDEHVGITGVAHLFEHMAFKGSREIGTKNFDAEQEVFTRLDAAFDAMKAEEYKVGGPDPAKLAALTAAFVTLQEEAGTHVENNEYSVIVERNGGSGLNASTGFDTTQYFISFPANRLELWFFLEADRFREPVLREFYKEKDVVLEERRMRTESNPVGRMIEEFLSTAYKAHPYGYPTVGHSSDMKTLRRHEADAFFRKHYVPNNMVVALVGDIDPERAHELAKQYFGPLKRGPKAEPVETIEPEQQGEKRVTVESQAQAIVGVGFHKPAATDKDEAVWDVISMLLSDGRTSRLYKRLVKEEKTALQAGGFSGFPGNKYPNLFMLYAAPNVGHTAEELEAALIEEAYRLKTEPISPEELARVKTRARAGQIRGLNSNNGLAMQLCTAQVIFGDWKEAFSSVRKIDAVTAEDVQRVAKTYFTRKNRIVGSIVKPEGEEETE